LIEAQALVFFSATFCYIPHDHLTIRSYLKIAKQPFLESSPIKISFIQTQIFCAIDT
jgi:hypothetical protein